MLQSKRNVDSDDVVGKTKLSKDAAEVVTLIIIILTRNLRFK